MKLGCLVLPLLVAKFDGLCTQLEEKQLCTLVAQYGLQTLHQTSERMLDTAFIGYGVERGLYTILGKTSYTIHLPSLQEQAFAFLHIVILCKRKI